MKWCWLFLGAIGGTAACSRAEVYPITRDAPAGRGASGGASGSGSGGSGAGGSAGASPPACPSPAIAPGDSNRTIVVGSVNRSFILHVPPAYEGREPAPLVLDFHGMGESAASERSSSPYPATLDASGVVMAFPEGLRGPAGLAWNVGPCCVADVDDVAFARAVVAEVQKLACIDATRVYAVGVLTGGGMAHYLACHAADLFAAVSPAAFDLLEENVDDCRPARPIGVVSFRGTADMRVPYAGGASSLVPGMPITFLGARATFDKWAEIDGCTGAASPADENGCSTHSACAGGAAVVLCTAEGGREGPGDPSIAWPILERHTL
ncbi:MAG TPA: PHB depolymerase family esterase [Polyangiaceae bacterium]